MQPDPNMTASDYLFKLREIIHSSPDFEKTHQARELFAQIFMQTATLNTALDCSPPDCSHLVAELINFNNE